MSVDQRVIINDKWSFSLWRSWFLFEWKNRYGIAFFAEFVTLDLDNSYVANCLFFFGIQIITTSIVEVSFVDLPRGRYLVLCSLLQVAGLKYI